MRRVIPFSFEREQKAASDSIGVHLKERMDPFIRQITEGDNVVRYSHGASWVGPMTENGDSEGTFVPFETEMTIRFQDIVNGEIHLVETLLHRSADQLGQSLSNMLFSKLDEATERTGNIVRGDIQRPFHDTMIEMLEKIKFGVGRDGEVALPSMVVSPAQMNLIKKSFDNIDGASAARIEELTAARIAEAKEEELKRIARFEVSNEG